MYKSGYQPYYTNRNKKKNTGGKILAIILALAVLGGGIYFLTTLGSKLEETQTPATPTTTNTITTDRFVGKEVSFAGTLSGSSEPLQYSRSIVTDNDETLYINSSRLDLNDYEGFVHVKGTVSKIANGKFIVDVSAIGDDENALNSMEFAPTDGITYLPNVALKIDTTTTPGVTYIISNDTITFSSEGSSGTVEVEGFKCETGFPEKDCTALKNEYTESSFANKANMTIGKSKTGSGWFAHNTAGAGYKIQADTDALLYKISGVLTPIDESYIKGLVPSINKLCADSSSATNATITKESLTSWTVKTNTCTARVTIDGTDGEKVSIVSQDTASTNTDTPDSNSTNPNGEQNTTTNTDTANNNTTDSDTASNTTPAPRITTTGTDFTSARGNYTITFPATNVMRNGTNVTEDLDVKGLSCYVRIDVKAYTDRENDAIGPAVQIYECTSKLAASTIQANTKDYIFNTSSDGTKLFFTKVLNSNWNEFANKIAIK